MHRDLIPLALNPKTVGVFMKLLHSGLLLHSEIPALRDTAIQKVHFLMSSLLGKTSSLALDLPSTWFSWLLILSNIFLEKTDLNIGFFHLYLSPSQDFSSLHLPYPIVTQMFLVGFQYSNILGFFFCIKKFKCYKLITRLEADVPILPNFLL